MPTLFINGWDKKEHPPTREEFDSLVLAVVDMAMILWSHGNKHQQDDAIRRIFEKYGKKIGLRYEIAEFEWKIEKNPADG